MEFEWNHHFWDEQSQGPFAYWRHCHRVSEEVRDKIEGTLVVDDLIYELPLGCCLNRPTRFAYAARLREFFDIAKDGCWNCCRKRRQLFPSPDVG